MAYVRILFEHKLIVSLKLLGTAANVVAYGHLGDGNLHLNISTQQYDDSVIIVFPIHLYLDFIILNCFYEELCSFRY